MKHIKFYPLFFCLIFCACSKEKTKYEESLFKTALFHEVQMQSVFSDSKTFADCIPNGEISSILKKYKEESTAKNFNLHAFVKKHFTLPQRPDTTFSSTDSLGMFAHIDQLWSKLTRSPDKQETNGSLIALPYEYVVPGGRFSEVYYWDSYFTMLGLMEDRNYLLVEHMLDNFAFLIDSLGHIPNGNRSYYVSRSQPPFFALMVELYARGDDAILLKYLPQMEKEYAFWMSGIDAEKAEKRVVKVGGFNVNRFWDDDPSPRPESYKEDVESGSFFAEGNKNEKQQFYRNIRAACESGWDFSSRWLVEDDRLITIKTTDFITVDLNCLLYKMEMVIANAYEAKDRLEDAVILKESAAERKAFIQQYCWDEHEGYYFDYNSKSGRLSKKYTLAGVYPLFVGIADSVQARLVEDVIREKFLQPGGLVTTTITSGQQWDAPNGWAPLQWIAVKGLLNYGFDSLALEVADRWLLLNEKVYLETGKMMEKYNVVDTTLAAGGGEYPSQDGFGWTNGVALKLEKLLEVETRQ